MLHALKDAENAVSKIKAEKKILESKNRDLSAHLALANNRIDFSRQDTHSMWKEVIYYRDKYHILQRQHQDVLRVHSTCAIGPPEQPYVCLLQELEKLQDMYRHILGQNTTLKFEVQRLMQQCVNSGLIPPPQNYTVTPIPALQPVRQPVCRFLSSVELRNFQPSMQPGTSRRASEPAVGQQQLQLPVQFSQVRSSHLHLLYPFFTLPKTAQPGPVARQFVSPPLNQFATNPSAADNPAIIAGPIQAYNYHRAQFPQPQQSVVQPMPPPQQRGYTPVFQQQSLAARPRQVIDLTIPDDERVHKRPRLASDPAVYTQQPPGSLPHLQHQVNAQMPVPTPYPVFQQSTQPAHPYHPQRPGTGPPNLHSPPTYVVQYGTGAFLKTPIPSTSAPPVMGAYGAVTDGQTVTQLQGQSSNGQVQGAVPPRQMYMGPVHPTNVTSPTVEASANHNGMTPTERPIGTPVVPASTDSLPASPRAVSNTQEPSSPPLTEEQTERMRSEVADSMFTEPEDGDEAQTRTCELCVYVILLL